ncbi:hypothetical protein NPIL_46351, partial [Nephila pilipes]
ASSSCNLTIGCKSKGADDYFCGPFWISWAYWYDGGRHGNTGKPEGRYFFICSLSLRYASAAYFNHF